MVELNPEGSPKAARRVTIQISRAKNIKKPLHSLVDYHSKEFLHRSWWTQIAKGSWRFSLKTPLFISSSGLFCMMTHGIKQDSNLDTNWSIDQPTFPLSTHKLENTLMRRSYELRLTFPFHTKPHFWSFFFIISILISFHLTKCVLIKWHKFSSHFPFDIPETLQGFSLLRLG